MSWCSRELFSHLYPVNGFEFVYMSRVYPNHWKLKLWGVWFYHKASLFVYCQTMLTHVIPWYNGVPLIRDGLRVICLEDCRVSLPVRELSLFLLMLHTSRSVPYSIFGTLVLSGLVLDLLEIGFMARTMISFRWIDVFNPWTTILRKC